MLTHVRFGFESISHADFFKRIHKAGLGKIKHILYEAEMLGWDFNCWIVEMNNGDVKAFTMVDATFVDVSVEDLKKHLARTRASAVAIEQAIAAVEVRADKA